MRWFSAGAIMADEPTRDDTIRSRIDAFLVRLPMLIR
jgi:hypothetical protein